MKSWKILVKLEPGFPLCRGKKARLILRQAQDDGLGKALRRLQIEPSLRVLGALRLLGKPDTGAEQPHRPRIPFHASASKAR